MHQAGGKSRRQKECPLCLAVPKQTEKDEAPNLADDRKLESSMAAFDFP